MDNKDIHNHWNQIKPQVLAHWNKLSEVEVEKTHGSVASLGKLVRSKYGSSQVNFEKEYEVICDHVHEIEALGSDLDDDIDEAGITRFDNDHSADYTGFKLNSGVRLSERDQEELLQPDLKGMEASEVELPIKAKMNEIRIKQNTNNRTATDEFKPNQVPSSSQRKDITSGRSNSSANTTSPSALTSSEATKKL